MSLNVENILKKFFDKYFNNMHPETALRYLPVVGKLEELNLLDSKILEVGSGSLGITPYLKRKIDGLDVDFSGPKTILINRIKGNALSLPFRKNSYDVVISVDVLEHIPSNNRQEAIFEMLRVASKLAIIVVPTGELAEKQDKELDLHWQKIFNTQNQFLKEHVQNGLPQIDEILVSIDKAKRQIGKIVVVKSKPILNLGVRKILMKSWISKNKYMYYLYLKGFLLLLPFLRNANFGKCYRRIFVIEFVSPAKSPLVSSTTNIEKVKG